MKAESLEKSEAAIAALLMFPTIGAAAAAVGISESTLYRLKKDENFQREYRQRRREILHVAQARLVAATAGAVDVLIDVASDTNTPPSVRVTAAMAILEQAIKADQQLDVEARMAPLDDLLGF